jgi:hypothetical protein
MKCYNAYTSIQQDRIQIDQKPIPQTTSIIWYIVFAAGGVLIILIIICWWCVKHTHHKNELSERHELVMTKMKEIEETNTIDRRNSVMIPREHFDDLRDMASLHPDFAKGGRNNRN